MIALCAQGVLILAVFTLTPALIISAHCVLSDVWAQADAEVVRNTRGRVR
jgi:hypothetical protein